MKRHTSILAAMPIAAWTWGGAGQAAELDLKRVMLSSAGVGYFEYAAEVDGPATLGLDVPLDQVDDVLKSLVVFDSTGSVGGVELPGRDSGHTAFGDVPFGPEALQSPLALINSLQGVEVTVQGPRPMTGRILQAETVHDLLPGGTTEAPRTQDRTRVSLLTADGLKQFVLEDVEAVQVADPGLRARIERALAASRRESGQDQRHLTIRSAGAGHRTVRVSYVAVAPLWKASYRLVLEPVAAGGTETARLQAWATLENGSGTDWSGVALTLQYGNPITFHQAIYRSYFVERPEVPVEVLGRLLPDVDTRAREKSVSDEAAGPGGASPPPSPMPMAASAARGLVAEPQVMQLARPSEPAGTSEGAEETVFALATPVTLAAGHSASVPLLDRELPASRIDLAHPDETNPRAAVRLRNASPESLPAGVLTLYDGAGEAPYAGDARLGGLPAGESRLLTFAQDLRTTVEWRNTDNIGLASLRASGGVLTLDERQRRVSHVTLTAPQNEARHVLLEAPKPSTDAAIAPDFMQPAEQTATAWRFAVDLHAGEVRDLTFAVDRLHRRSIALLREPGALAGVLSMQGLSDPARRTLEHVAELRVQESARLADREQLVGQRQTVEKDEERIRANLVSVPAGEALHARLIRELDADETRIGQLDTAIAGASQAVTAAHQALADAIGALRL